MRSGLKQIKRQQRFNQMFELPEYAQPKKVYSSQLAFEQEHFGGKVERTILRRVFGEDIWEEMNFGQASWELTGFAQVQSEETEFREYHGKQIRELLKVDNLFNCPWFNAALCELLDAGCSIKTQRAEYKIGERIVKKGNTFCFVSPKTLKKAA